MANITGTNSNDTILPLGVSVGVTGGIPSNDADFIEGLSGRDSIDGGGGNDTIDGGAANDTLYGGDGSGDVGQPLDEVLAANPSQPISIPTESTAFRLTSMGRMLADDGQTYTVWCIRNGTGTNEDVTLKFGSNVVFNDTAPANTDTFVASLDTDGAGADTHKLIWGEGSQTKAAGTQTFSYNTLVGGGGGTDGGDDQISGGTGSDNIDGGGGNDTLEGENGVDTIMGGDGDDIITGGTKNDFLTGGDGADIFNYTNLGDSQTRRNWIDVITDYTSSEDFIDAPNSVNAATLDSLVGNAVSLSATDISNILTPAVFAANTAVAFTVTGESGTFIALNNGTAGFQDRNDAIIQLENYTIGVANPVEVI